jgi:hypothetical protein
LPSVVLAIAWRTFITPIFVPVAEPGAALCARSPLAPKAQAAATIAIWNIFLNLFLRDPVWGRVKILEFTFFSLFLSAQNLSRRLPA